MPNSNSVLLTKYLHRTSDVMVLAWLWAEHVSKFAIACGYDYTELHDNPVTREQFQSALASKDPLFFHGLGHGNVDVFTGGATSSGWSLLLKASENPQDCANRITYLMSCDTAVQLGPAIINAGGLAFSGYYYPYGTVELNVALEGLEKAKYGRWHWGPMDQSNLIANGLLRGLTLADATAKAIERCNAWIDYFSRSGETYADWQIGALVQNRDGLTNLGDVNAKLNPTTHGKHTRATYAIGSTGMIVGENEPFTLNVGCSCQVDHCNFVGKSFSVKNLVTGNMVNGTFTNFDRGLNWGSAEVVAGPAGDVEVYEIRVEADANHDETVGGAVTLPVQYLFIVICYDDVTLNPVCHATVTLDDEQGSTNEQGVFYLEKHVLTVHCIINADGYDPVDIQLKATGAFEDLHRFYMRKSVRPVKIKGTVKARSGDPLPNAKVFVGASTINLRGDMGHPRYYAITDVNGNFELPDFVPKDRYGVLVIKDGERGSGEALYVPYIGYIDCLTDGDNYFDFALDEAPAYDPELYVHYVAGFSRDIEAGCTIPNVEVNLSFNPHERIIPAISSIANEFGFYVAKVTAPLIHMPPSNWVCYLGLSKFKPQFLPSPPLPTGGWTRPNYGVSRPQFTIHIPLFARRDVCSIYLAPIDTNPQVPMLFLFSGFVRDNNSLAPIPNAKITIDAISTRPDDTRFPPFSCQATTNELGHFEMTVMKMPAYALQTDPPFPFYNFSLTVEAGEEKITEAMDIYVQVGTHFDIRMGAGGGNYSNVTIRVSGEGSTEPPIGNYPSTYKVGDSLYVTATPASGWLLSVMQRKGENWTDSNPGEFLNLQATEDINVVFEEIPHGKGVLEVHVFEDSVEVAAVVEIVGVGPRTTPFAEVLDPGFYDLNIIFKNVTKTDTVEVVESETTKVDYSFSSGPDFPFKNLKRFPRLYKFVYGVWVKRKRK